MPAYEDKLTPTQRWQAVDYIRTFRGNLRMPPRLLSSRRHPAIHKVRKTYFTPESALETSLISGTVGIS